MVFVMFLKRQYFVCSLALFSVNAHGLRLVADKFGPFIYLLVLADDTITTVRHSFWVCSSLSTTQRLCTFALMFSI